MTGPELFPYPPARIGLVVSYYNPSQDAALRAQTELCALRALQSQNERIKVHVLVSDGTGQLDTELQARLTPGGIAYLPSPTPLGFAQGYNQGLRHWATQPNPPELLATCANDVFTDRQTLPLLAGALLTDSTVGCAIPYLSHSDYLTQNDTVIKRYREASSMTLNLNVFRREDLEAVGFIPEQLSGYFNDVALMWLLKQRGLKVVIINGGKVNHLTRTTVGTQSQARLEADTARFPQLYPELALPNHLGFAEEKLAAGRLNRLWYKAYARAGAGRKRFMHELARLAHAWRYFAATAFNGNVER